MASSSISVGTPIGSGLSTHTMRAPKRRIPSQTYMTEGKF
jgi:hypothetical protein